MVEGAGCYSKVQMSVYEQNSQVQCSHCGKLRNFVVTYNGELNTWKVTVQLCDKNLPPLEVDFTPLAAIAKILTKTERLKIP